MTTNAATDNRNGQFISLFREPIHYVVKVLHMDLATGKKKFESEFLRLRAKEQADMTGDADDGGDEVGGAAGPKKTIKKKDIRIVSVVLDDKRIVGPQVFTHWTKALLWKMDRERRQKELEKEAEAARLKAEKADRDAMEQRQKEAQALAASMTQYSIPTGMTGGAWPWQGPPTGASMNGFTGVQQIPFVGLNGGVAAQAGTMGVMNPMMGNTMMGMHAAGTRGAYYNTVHGGDLHSLLNIYQTGGIQYQPNHGYANVRAIATPALQGANTGGQTTHGTYNSGASAYVTQVPSAPRSATNVSIADTGYSSIRNVKREAPPPAQRSNGAAVANKRARDVNYASQTKEEKEEETDTEDENDNLACSVCGKVGDSSTFLLCDETSVPDHGCHMGCLRPPLSAIPKGEWYCPLHVM